MTRVYLDVATNVDRRSSIERGLMLLQSCGTVAGTSAVYESAAWGPPGQPPFHNLAVAIDTALDPVELRQRLREVEALAGRVRTANRFAPRPLDIDIILFGDLVVEGDGWRIPHPQLETQPFVLVPLAELAPDLLHPVLHQPLRHLLAAHPDFPDRLTLVI